MKRSSAVALTLMSASMLAGCEESIDTFTYPTVEACVAAKVYTRAACLKGFDEALIQTGKVAPKFASKADCEEEFGQCGPAPAQAPSAAQVPKDTTASEAKVPNDATASAGGGFSFMPFMVGYMMGNMMSNRQVATQPLYRSRSGGYFTAGGTEVTRQLGARTSVKPSQVSAPKPTTTTMGRGGFGSGRGGFSS